MERSLTERLLNTSRRPETLNRVRTIPAELGGKLKERRGSHTWDCPLAGGEISWDRGELWVLEESAATRLRQAGPSEACRDGLCQSPAGPILRHVSAGADGGWNCGV